ncbi:hypothetical protein VRU48_12760 [Pedobacter sp. KR3-3]|uniref:Flippase-like domain-containing protein n=1 Tax=Pedobacter albus TaxID=3113905 RepID=A0ABU7I9X5_9SPHI|nr:hypothetical protein [Pedobacter sp. KR3-3]MEE1945984.1 hypothetical protein [Pedobacter sp. KR3-3]
MTARYKKIFSILLKIAIVVFAFWFIYHKLIANNDLKQFVAILKAVPVNQIWIILSIVVLLMLLNWGLEAVKWKRLIKQVEEISLWKAVESVFCGLTWAVFTPNRLGEYGGRVFFLSPKRRIVGVVAMAVGNIGQLVLTNVFGAIAVCLFVYRFTPIDYRLFLALCAIGIAFCLFFIIFYFNIKWLNGILLSMRFTRKYKKFYTILARYRKAELLKILLLCLARYAVFSTQYFIMFLWLIPGLHFVDILMLICILFFVQSSLPSLDLLDIGIRSVTALFFFKYVTDQNTAVVACIASIWLINIIIPAILGSYFVFKLNFFGSTQRN